MKHRKQIKCEYCYGHGLYKSYWKHGLRRPIESGPFGRPVRDDAYVPCDRCGPPKPLAEVRTI